MSISLRKSTTLRIQSHKNLRINVFMLFSRFQWLKQVNIVLFSLLVVFTVTPVCAEQWKTIIDAGDSSVNSSSGMSDFNDQQNIIDDKNIFPTERVAYFTGSTVKVPGATILYKGNVYDNEISVTRSENALLAISLENKIYFYHPAVGETELSKKTDKLSLIYFLLGVTPENISGPILVASKDNLSGKEVTPGVQIFKPGDNRLLDDIGFRVIVGEIPDGKRCTMDTTNIFRRWAAVKKTGPSEQVTYFPPRANILPKSIADGFYRYWVAKGNRSWAHFLVIGQTSTFIFEPPQEFEFMGAGWRSLILPLCLPRQQYIPFENRKILADLDDLGFKFSIINIIQDFLGLIPLECADVVNNIAGVGLTDMWLDAYNKPGNLAQVRLYLANSGLLEVANSLFSCVFSQLTLKGNVKFQLKLEMFNTVWDSLNFLSTITGEIVGTNTLVSQKLRYKKIKTVFGTLSVIVAPDKDRYKAKEMAIFSGFVRAEGKAVENASVTIVVKSADTSKLEAHPDKIQWTVKTDAEGHYVKKHTLALLQGSYVVSACTVQSGYEKGCATARFSISEGVASGMVEKWYVYHTCNMPTNSASPLHLRKTTKNWLKNRAKKFGHKLTIIHAYKTREEALRTTCAQFSECIPASPQGLRNHAFARLGGSFFNVKEFMRSDCTCLPVE